MIYFIQSFRYADGLIEIIASIMWVLWAVTVLIEAITEDTTRPVTHWLVLVIYVW